MIKNSLQALKMHVFKSATNGSPLAILFAQFALFIATLFVWNTSSFAEYDSTGIKTVLSYQIISTVLVSNSRRLRGLGFIHRECDSKVNSIANLIYLILAIVFEHFYEKSLSSLGFVLSITVLFLILLVIIQPSTDLGLVDFLIGVIGSVAYSLFSLKFQTWIVVAICFLLLRFRCWLDKDCLPKEDDQSLHTCRSTEGKNQISKLEIIEAITVLCFHLFWVYNLFRTNCRKVKGPPESISCTSSPIMGMLACVLIFNLWFGLAVIHRVYSWFKTTTTIIIVIKKRIKPTELVKQGLELARRKTMLALSLLYVLDNDRKIMPIQPLLYLLYVLDEVLKVMKGVQKVGEGVLKAVQKVGEGVLKAREGVQKVVQKAGEGVQRVVQKAGEGVQNAGEEVQRVVQKAGEGVQKGVQNAGEEVQRVVQKAGEGVQKVGEGVQNVEEGVQRAVQKAGEGVQKVGEGVQKAGKGVQKAVQKVGEGVQNVGKEVQNAGKDVQKVGKKVWKGIKKAVNKH